jgi:hypothetical protein
MRGRESTPSRRIERLLLQSYRELQAALSTANV